MNLTKYPKLSLLALAAAGVLLIALINTSLARFRVDLTADRIYTVSEGVHNFLGSLEENVSLTLYFSEANTRDAIPLRNYRQRIVELIQEYVLIADGKLSFSEVDPEPFSIQEDEANAAGVNAVALNDGKPDIFFGINAVSSRGQQSISFLHPQRERLLEYDINNLIYQALSPAKPTVGLLSSLSVDGGYGQAGPLDPWVSIDQLQQGFTMQKLSNDLEQIPEDIDALLLLHPADLGPKTLYAIDQYVLGGGKLVAFLDPYSEYANPMVSGSLPAQENSATDFADLLAAWGLSLDAEHVVVDANHAMEVSFGGRRQRHPTLLNYERTGFDREDPISANLSRLLLSTSGYLQAQADSGLEISPIMQTSANTGLIPTSEYSVQDLESNFANIQATSEQYTLAARVSGRASSAYPQGVEVEIEIEPEANLSDANASAEPETVTQTEIFQHADPLDGGDINVVVVADSDMLSDRLWVGRQNFFGQVLLTPFTDNNDFFQNALASYTGNDDLIGIRGRQPYARYFDRVEDLRRVAEERLRATQEQLQQRLQQTEQQLNQLQSQRDSNETIATLTPEQEAAIAQFSKERIEIRKQLRSVRHQLDRDIEALGMRVKLVNIALVPLLIVIFALARHWWRRR